MPPRQFPRQGGWGNSRVYAQDHRGGLTHSDPCHNQQSVAAFGGQLRHREVVAVGSILRDSKPRVEGGSIQFLKKKKENIRFRSVFLDNYYLLKNKDSKRALLM